MLEKIFDAVRNKLNSYFEQREDLIKESRYILRLSREAIQMTHKGNYIRAYELIIKAKNLVKKLGNEKIRDPRLRFSGFWLDITKEFAEAFFLYVFVSNIVRGENLSVPDPRELGILEEAWVLGLCEAAGELKREMLILAGKNDFRNAKRLLEVTREIYGLVSSLVLPNAVIPGLKSKIDYLRSILISSEELLLRLEKEYDLIQKLS